MHVLQYRKPVDLPIGNISPSASTGGLALMGDDTAGITPGSAMPAAQRKTRVNIANTIDTWNIAFSFDKSHIFGGNKNSPFTGGSLKYLCSEGRMSKKYKSDPPTIRAVLRKREGASDPNTILPLQKKA